MKSEKKTSTPPQAGRRSLHWLVRFLALIGCWIVAITIHHWWFDLGSRGFFLGLADGAILAILGLFIAWAYGCLYESKPRCQGRQRSWRTLHGRCSAS